jgi:hypothetical protein
VAHVRRTQTCMTEDFASPCIASHCTPLRRTASHGIALSWRLKPRAFTRAANASSSQQFVDLRRPGFQHQPCPEARRGAQLGVRRMMAVGYFDRPKALYEEATMPGAGSLPGHIARVASTRLRSSYVRWFNFQGLCEHRSKLSRDLEVLSPRSRSACRGHRHKHGHRRRSRRRPRRQARTHRHGNSGVSSMSQAVKSKTPGKTRLQGPNRGLAGNTLPRRGNARVKRTLLFILERTSHAMSTSGGGPRWHLLRRARHGRHGRHGPADGGDVHAGMLIPS